MRKREIWDMLQGRVNKIYWQTVVRVGGRAKEKGKIETKPPKETIGVLSRMEVHFDVWGHEFKMKPVSLGEDFLQQHQATLVQVKSR